jgi:cyclopropane fatty-acyl-phospholipid synthase-like methyltransferase
LAGESAVGFVLLSEASRMPQPAPAKSAEAKAFEEMKDTLQVGVQVVSAPQLFPTPAELADRVIELAGIEAGNTILEPSAGTGALLDALSRKPLAFLGGLTVVEINRTLCDALEARGLSVHCADFLCWNIGGITKFDRIVMNPPFHNAEDLKHIEHARKMLAPGGRLVAICANGPRQRAQLMPQADQWIDLSAGSFPGTGVTVAIVVFGAQAHH